MRLHDAMEGWGTNKAMRRPSRGCSAASTASRWTALPTRSRQVRPAALVGPEGGARRRLSARGARDGDRGRRRRRWRRRASTTRARRSTSAPFPPPPPTGRPVGARGAPVCYARHAAARVREAARARRAARRGNVARGDQGLWHRRHGAHPHHRDAQQALSRTHQRRLPRTRTLQSLLSRSARATADKNVWYEYLAKFLVVQEEQADAMIIDLAMNGDEVDTDALTEFLVGRHPRRVRAAKETWEAKNDDSLVDKLQRQPGRHLPQALPAHAQGQARGRRPGGRRAGGDSATGSRRRSLCSRRTDRPSRSRSCCWRRSARTRPQRTPSSRASTRRPKINRSAVL